MIYLQYWIIVNYHSRPLRSKALQNPKKNSSNSRINLITLIVRRSKIQTNSKSIKLNHAKLAIKIKSRWIYQPLL